MPVKSGHQPRSNTRAYSSPAREAAAEETRARIIAAALALLGGGEGLPAFSIDGVARHAGVTRLTLYNQFVSKRGLLEAVFDDMAQRGGLLELHQVMAEPDPQKALHRCVAVFCRFWAGHLESMPKFQAVVKLDDEIASSLRERTERRRQLLATLVKKLTPATGKAHTDLVDVLFALTAFEMYQALSVRNRSAEAIRALVLEQVDEAVKRSAVSRSK